MVDAPPTAEELGGLLASLQPLGVRSPRDPSLARSYRRLLSEDLEAFVCKRNRRHLAGVLRRNALSCPALLSSSGGGGGGGGGLGELLARRRLRDAEAARVALLALQEELAGASFPPRGGSAGEAALAADEEGFAVVSGGALETALRLVLRAAGAASGLPAGRSREELAALAADKHERALVSNVISPADIGVTYEMIGGLKKVKDVLRQTITYPLKFPQLYAEGIAAEAVKGLLLFGPPGTGKTMLAKAVATEGGATFLSVDASTIENKWLGESEKNAKAVFTLARRLAPCVVFLDEVDSILSSREHGDDSTHGTLTSVKTTLMQEWDGLQTTSDRVVVIASTNRPFDLDEAVLRRLPRRIFVDLPDAETRQEILRVTLAQNRLAPDVNLTTIAADLEGYTGSDIKEVCREAVLRISHEAAAELEARGGIAQAAAGGAESAALRPVAQEDFQHAMDKLSASVSEKGREMQRVLEWNDQYGEIKSARKDPYMSLYL